MKKRASRMTAGRKKRLQKAGWRVGSADEFLGLTAAESAFLDAKTRLTSAFVERRQELDLTQTEVAKRLGSSQSRIAKIEASDPSVSLDLLVRSLLALGASRKKIALAFASI